MIAENRKWAKSPKGRIAFNKLTSNKAKTYKEALKVRLWVDLRDTRKEPGLSIKEVAKLIKQTFAAEEIVALVDILAKEDILWKLNSKN